jgi:hypothetical protein
MTNVSDPNIEYQASKVTNRYISFLICAKTKFKISEKILHTEKVLQVGRQKPSFLAGRET